MTLGTVPGAEFAGLYPDGSVYVATARLMGISPRSYGGSLQNAGLYDTTTGALIDNSGIPASAAMPTFSPDGSQLAFTDVGTGTGHTLARMRFSIATHTASALQSIYSASTQYVGWPAFLPDGNALIFTQSDSSDFSGLSAGLTPLIIGPATDLFVTDISTGAATLLAQAMGFRSTGDAEAGPTYLPGGAGDLHQNYYPTVSPVATGGYAWVFFDSVRSYGNLGVRRAIWGTAVSLSANGTYDADPSHPAFYLPGQTLNTANFRGVAVLDP